DRRIRRRRTPQRLGWWRLGRRRWLGRRRRRRLRRVWWWWRVRWRWWRFELVAEATYDETRRIGQTASARVRRWTAFGSVVRFGRCRRAQSEEVRLQRAGNSGFAAAGKATRGCRRHEGMGRGWKSAADDFHVAGMEIFVRHLPNGVR